MTDHQKAAGSPGQLPDDRAIYDVIFGLFARQAFLVAFDLGLFTLLADQAATVPKIASKLGLSERSTEAMVIVSLSLGFLERDNDTVRLSETGSSYLVPGRDTYMGDFIRGACILQPEVTSFETVRKAIVNDKAQVYGGGKMFEHHREVEERAIAFTRMMHGHSIGPALEWPSKFDLSGVQHMLDIGGGSGAHAIGALLRWPELHAEVIELPTVVSVVQEFAKQYKVSDRLSVTAGDFWTDPFPEGDLHFYGDVLHDWPDEKCRAMLAKSFNALPPGGLIMLHEIIYNHHKTGPLAAAGDSVAMLVWTEGKQRSAAEFASMLEATGFEETVTKPSFGYWSIVAARKPK